MLHPPHYIFLIKAPNENGVKQFQQPVVVCVSVRVDLCVYQGLDLSLGLQETHKQRLSLSKGVCVHCVAVTTV